MEFENKPDESDNENVTDESDNENVTDESDYEVVTDESDYEFLSDESFNEILTDESYNESLTDESDDETEPTEEEKEYFKAFVAAVDEKNEDVINILIRKEGILEKRFFCEERTFLHIVAENGTVETAKEIIRLGANVDFANTSSKTPIFFAIENSLEMVKTLAQHGADVNYSDNLNMTPIYYAIKKSAEMVKILIENGANVNFRRRNYETPMHHAIRHSAEIVKILLQNGARVHVKSENGIALLHEALYSGTVETVRLILNKILSIMRKYLGPVEKTEEIVQVILRNQGILNIVKKTYPLLIFFAAKISEDMLKFLLDNLGNLKYRTNNLSLPAMEIRRRGYFGRTALHYAVREQLPEVVRLLLKSGANVNTRTCEGLTPLHYAASLENEEICQILLSYGADVEANSREGETPLHQVCGNRCVRSHLESGDGYYYRGYISCGNRREILNPKIVKLLLQNGANPNKPDSKGIAPFLSACLSGNLELLKILLEFGANLQVIDTYGNSALHYATIGNSLEIVDFLLKKGLNINIRSHFNNTPLLLMTHLHNPAHLEMFMYLIDQGADINSQDSDHRTALYLCSCFESSDLVSLLLESGADVKSASKIDTSNYDFELVRFREVVEDFFPMFTLNRHKLKPLFNVYLKRVPFGCARNTLIPFIALNGNVLWDYMENYFINDKELSKGFEHFLECRLEVEKLKSMKLIRETRISFHDFLTVDIYLAVQIVKKEEIKEMFESRDYYKEFPCYSFLLEKRFERIVILKNAVDKTENFLMNYLLPLPTLVTGIILSRLSASDFRNFDRSLCMSHSLAGQEPDTNLEFYRTYDAKIMEIREDGVMVALYPNMPPVLLNNSELYADSTLLTAPLNLKVGEKISVLYLGRYSESGVIRLSAKISTCCC